MDSVLGECSVMKQITKTEEAIKICYERIETLERRSDTYVTEDKKEAIKHELKELRKLLATNEEQLSHLHRHNRKSFAFVAAFCFVCFAVYALYILVEGRDF